MVSWQDSPLQVSLLTGRFLTGDQAIWRQPEQPTRHWQPAIYAQTTSFATDFQVPHTSTICTQNALGNLKSSVVLETSFPHLWRQGTGIHKILMFICFWKDVIQCSDAIQVNYTLCPVNIKHNMSIQFKVNGPKFVPKDKRRLKGCMCLFTFEEWS